MTALYASLRDHLTRMFPGSTIASLEPLAADARTVRDTTEKSAGYGEPVRVILVDRAGHTQELVWHAVLPNEFGHDRRADRAAQVLQAYEDAALPGHVGALDVGFVQLDGGLCSLRDTGEPYMITRYARGHVYAEDLQRIATARTIADGDLARLDVLARYLADLHTPIPDGAVRYRRAIRDLVGSGEGIFGIIDGFPPDCVAEEVLRELEEDCASWRWRLRDASRLTRTHGDFHPFNLIFDGSSLALLDASRGGCGDPADDLTALAVNFLLFAIDEPAAWRGGLGVLWRHWWTSYFAFRDDAELLAAAPPFLAWRILVVCNPRFYPRLSARGRDRLLGFARETLAAHVLDPINAEELFR